MSSPVRWLAALLLINASTVLAQGGAPGMPPARVEVATAEQRVLEPLVDVTGSIVSRNDSRLATEVDGVLVWIAEVGDEVAEGDVVARLEPRLLDVAVRRARASVDRLTTDLRLAERQLQRAQDLAQTNNASATLLDESLAARDVALSELADARAVLDRAEGDLERAELRAPFAGHVVQRLAGPGEYLAVGEAVVRLVDTRRLEVALPVPIDLAGLVVPGRMLDVSRDATQRRYPVRTVVPVGDPISRMVEVRLAVAGEAVAGAGWLVGTPVTVAVPGAAPVSGIVVPRDALVERGQQVHVFRVAPDGTAEQMPVMVRARVGFWVAVDGDLAAADRVIVRGAERLAPGQPVEIIKSQEVVDGPR